MSLLPSAYSDSGDVFSSRLKRIQDALRKSAEEQFQVDEIEKQDANATSYSVLKYIDKHSFAVAPLVTDADEMPEEPSRTDPRFWYRFDHRGHYLYDESNFESRAKVHGKPKFMTGVDWSSFGGDLCWDFDGFNDYATTNTNDNIEIDNAPSFSLVFLIFPKDLSPQNGRLRTIIHHVEDITNLLWAKKIEVGPDGKVYFSLIINGVTKLFEIPATSVAINGWYWGIFTYNGTTCTCYINGVAKTVTVSTHEPFFTHPLSRVDDDMFQGGGIEDNFMSFNGIDEYMGLGTSGTLWNASLTSFSFSVWLRPLLVGGDGNFRETIQRGWGITHGFDLYFYSTLKRLYFELAGTWPARISTVYFDFTNLPVDEWYHVVVTYDSALGSQRTKIYVNKALGVQATDNAGVALLNTSELFLSGVGPDYQGEIKDFRWWTNLALNQTKVDALYNNGINGAVNPVVNAPNYWLEMDEGVASPIDKIGSLTTTLFNIPTWVKHNVGQWKGGIQDTRLYRRVLTQAEATSLNTNKISVTDILLGKVATVGASALNE
jgi:hypothetical protein